METKTTKELKAEVKGLGIEIKGNPSKETLIKKIDEFYESQSAGDLVKEVEEVEETTEATGEVYDVPGTVKELTKDQKLKKLVQESKKAALKTSVVTITSNDKRDNDVVTVAYLGFENQYFGISKLVPLDIPVQLEECLIEIARTTQVTLHKDEIINVKRTGNKIPVRARKLNVSYEHNQD